MSTVAVVGTGLMAPGIAAACASAGREVTVVGRSPERAAAAAARAAELTGGVVRSAAIEPEAFSGAGLVVETILEDATAKRALLARIEGWLEPDAIVATNTSSLPIGTVAGALERPERLAGLHFLNPAHLTAVVEVVAGPATSEPTLAALAELVRRMGKRPLVVRRELPGFVWNRLQFAILRECLHLLEQGVTDVASIDAAVSEGLAPRWLAAGPLATADLGGIGTFAIVSRELFPRLAATGAVSDELTRRIEEGGFYRWTAEARRELEAIRADALAFQRELAARRAGAMPPASDAAEGHP